MAMASLGSFTPARHASSSARYALAASRRRRAAPVVARSIESGIGAFYLVAGADDRRLGVIVHAFVTDNYAIKYVQHYSDAAQPLAYKITSYWGGLDGSIMFWVFLLSVFGIDRRRTSTASAIAS